jgi:aminoglycoside phosphotransferase (APT) family kinase protein
MHPPLNIEDRDALTAYLRSMGLIGTDESPVIRKLAGGVSNRTVLVRRFGGEAWVLKQALAKLRVDVDWFSSPDRSHREAQGIRRLAELAPAGSIPRLIFEDPSQHLLAMEAVPEPHQNWKTLLLEGTIDDGHVRQFGELLGGIHRAADQRRSELAKEFADRSFFETLRVEPYYAYTAIQVGEAAEFLGALIAETRKHQLTLVHGDYSPKNILVHQDRLVLLDHEVIHWGDPAFDLGFSLTHLLSKGHLLARRRPKFAAAAHLYRDAYCRALGDVPWGNELEPRWVRHTLGCLLARVCGRSKLEYLNEQQRNRQRSVTLDLIKSPPPDVAELVARFNEQLDKEER